MDKIREMLGTVCGKVEDKNTHINEIYKYIHFSIVGSKVMTK